MTMRRFATVCALICLAGALPVCAQTAPEQKSALAIRDAAFAQGSVKESIDYIRNNLDAAATAADRRSLLYTEGLLLEQLGFYAEASTAYATAAGITAADAAGMDKATPEQLVLAAVRCSLCAGDFETADAYLASRVRQSKDECILALVQLYGVWSALCRAQSVQETAPSVEKLRSFVTMASMKSVKPSVLLTLWYLTAQKEYADALKKEFPHSPEYGIVTGSAQIMSVPFWYFVPRSEHETASPPASGTRASPAAASPAAGRRSQSLLSSAFCASSATIYHSLCPFYQARFGI